MTGVRVMVTGGRVAVTGGGVMVTGGRVAVTGGGAGVSFMIVEDPARTARPILHDRGKGSRRRGAGGRTPARTAGSNERGMRLRKMAGWRGERSGPSGYFGWYGLSYCEARNVAFGRIV